MHSTALPRTLEGWLNRPPPKKGRKGGRIRSASPKRAKQLAFYRILRKGFLGAHRECQVNWAGCLGLSSEVHHRASRVGDKLNDTRDFVATCSPCHRAIHRNPSRARLQGLLK